MKNTMQHIDEYKVYEWKLYEHLGNLFEREIFQVINKQLANSFDAGVRILQTPVGPDGGKDIIIHSPIPLCILGQKFDMGLKNEITIYIECKSSEKKRIDLNKVAGSHMRVKDNKIDYYMLISNSSFTPQTLYILKSNFETVGIKFKLIDQYFLLKELNNETAFYDDSLKVDSKLYYEYQVSTTRVDNKNAYDIYFSYRNLGNEDQLVKQKLLTDNNWSIDKIERKFFVNANDVHITKSTVIRDYADGIDDLLFSVENNGNTEKQIIIDGAGVRPIFEPPFWGENHKKCESFLSSRIKESTSFDLCCIWGEAGIGKTRVFNEVYKKLDGQGFDFLSIPVRHNNKYIKDIKRFLISKNYLHKDDASQSLNEILLSSKNDYMRAVILMDDCHNIADNTLNDLKALNGTDIPITIVLCGRTDYSVGTNDYYSFVHYTENNQNIGTWHLTSFSDNDTQNFIRLIISRIPEVALEKIWKMSNNNPLFIIHFIEYLLELDLVELYNRSSVGVINVNTFNARLYIPDKVEGIYKERLEYLIKNEQDAEILLEYLYILSVLQDRQSKDTALMCLPEDKLNFLVQRRFLNLSDNGDIIFSHESFALYIRHILENDKKVKRKLATRFFNNYNYLLEYVSIEEKGVLALWAGKKKFAKECFDNIIRAIKHTTNHSAFNIDFNYNKYSSYIMELFSNDIDNKDFLIKVIKTKIYTSIHHFSPIVAINDCNDILKYIQKDKILRNNKALNNSVKQQKAHAMIIAGYMCDAELLMKELLSDWLVYKNTLDEDTLFDLLDRFCGVYIDLNCKDLAINYNIMSKEKAIDDNRLMALVYLNKAKIYFLKDFEQASQSLLRVQELLKNGDSKRIFCSSKISYLMIELLHNKRCDYINMIKESHSILKEAFEGNYAHAIARLYLILAALYLLSETPITKLQETSKLIDMGINYSIKFGFQRETWEFYNLLGIVQLRQGLDSEEIRKTFVTAFTLLQRHDYLNLGMRDLCCDNILVLSNIGFFYQSKKTEKEFYEYVTQVTFFGDSESRIKQDNTLPTNYLKQEYLKAKQKKLLFTNDPNNNLLRDSVTGYFIALS